MAKGRRNVRDATTGGSHTGEDSQAVNKIFADVAATIESPATIKKSASKATHLNPETVNRLGHAKSNREEVDAVEEAMLQEAKIIRQKILVVNTVDTAQKEAFEDRLRQFVQQLPKSYADARISETAADDFLKQINAAESSMKIENWRKKIGLEKAHWHRK